MKIAFGVCSLGIGHATRSLPVIRALVDEGHEVAVISHGRALSLLKREVPNVKFYDLPDYPIRYTQKAHQFFPYFIANSRKILKSMLDMHRIFLKIDGRENFDVIISDSRYDIFNRFKPSYLLIHQLRIMLKSSVLRGGVMLYNSYMTKFYNRILVPDFQDGRLSGKMARDLRFIPSEKIVYVGPLSSFTHLNLERDIDVLISISGPEPQRSILEKIVLEQIEDLKGNVVVTLGRPEGNKKVKSTAEIHYYLSANEREKIMNRSKVLISRSGYSTIMDLYVIGGHAGFIPTPGQPEQRYLARYLDSRGTAPWMTQDDLDLVTLVERSREYKGFEGGYDVKRSVEKIMEVIL